RAIGAKSAVEIRYIGTRFREGWTTYNMNETNILENGFLNEFKLAQANLYANIAAGRGTTFAYFGAGTGTNPLPIYLAHFSGTPIGQAGDPTKYTSASWSNAGFYNNLSQFTPAVYTAAGTSTSSTATGLNSTPAMRANALAAGLARNFWVANPDALGGANVLGDGGFTKNNSFQVQFRRRLSAGLQFDANFAVSRTYESVRYSLRVPRKLARDAGSPGDVSESFKATFVYELPFGGGKRWGSGVGPVMDRIIGGWQISGTTRVQTGRLTDLGNVRVIGMTPQEAISSFKLRKVDDKIMYMWPQDIIDNTMKAYARDLNGYTQGAPTGRYFAPANGPDCIETIGTGSNYGDCGVRTLVVTGPMYKNLDLSVVKDVRFSGRKSFQFRFDFLNAPANTVFTSVSNIGGANASTLSSFQLTGTQNSGRTGQLVFRFNW